MKIKFNSIITQMADEIKNWDITSSISHKAAELIRLMEPWKSFDADIFTQDFLTLKELNKQFSFGDGFGQPAITLWSNEDFRIELYFWNSSNTSVHSHAFAGAFTVLEGLSLQTRYHLKEVEFNEAQGTSTFTNDKKLHEFIYPGSIQEITPGMAFCHEVIHLKHPTVTFIIRTNKPICQQMQILQNGIFGFHFIPANEIVLLAKKMSLLNLRSKQGSNEVATFLKELTLSCLLNIKVNSAMWGFVQTDEFYASVQDILKEKLRDIHNLEIENILKINELEESDDPLATLTSCVYLHSIPIEVLTSFFAKMPETSLKTLLTSKRSMEGDIVYDKLVKLVSDKLFKK